MCTEALGVQGLAAGELICAPVERTWHVRRAWPGERVGHGTRLEIDKLGVDCVVELELVRSLKTT